MRTMLPHDLQEDETWSIAVWGPQCQGTCFKAPNPHAKASSPLPLGSPNMSWVLSEYWDLQEVFSKQKAQLLPVHLLYDCSIDILPGSSAPQSRRDPSGRIMM